MSFSYQMSRGFLGESCAPFACEKNRFFFLFWVFDLIVFRNVQNQVVMCSVFLFVESLT